MEPPVDFLTVMMIAAIFIMMCVAALAIGILIGGRKDQRHASPLDEAWIHRDLELYRAHRNGEDDR